MPVQMYKCPNCGGGVVFDPEKQNFECEYCKSRFAEQELKKPGEGERAGEERQTQEDRDAVLYSCPSCGAEIVTDETAAAMDCYYCHNPVVLSGRLDGAFRPDGVIPFSITKEQAVEAFMGWIGKKRFVPRSFFSKKQIEKITGVYYPYWMMDCEMDASLSARASTVRVWRSGDTEYTETRHFRIQRDGDIQFRELTKNALRKADHMLAEGVQPFDVKDIRTFTTAFLSGFQAEKRDVGREDLRDVMDRELQNASRMLLMDTVTGYGSVVPENVQAQMKDQKWRYVLLPVWVLTYKTAGKKLYYYAMNGQTGKVCGVLPVDFRRLLGLFAGVMLPLCALLLAGGWYFL